MIERLRPDPANPRQIEAAELDALTRSIRQYGFVQPIVATRDGLVVAGHQRLVAARRLGLASVPVIYVDLPVAEARTLALALNKISGTWDEQLLARLLAELQDAPGLDLGLSGFNEDEVTALLRKLDAQDKRDRPEAFDLDAALDSARSQPRAKPGDLWAFDESRLLNGDATRSEDLARVLDGRQADESVSDVPYSVDYRGGPAPTAKRRRPIANDALEPAAFAEFVRAWARNLLASVEGALYLFTGSKELPTISRILAEEGGHWSDTIIWNKGAFTLGRADYQRSYAPIWYGWREGSTHVWCGDRDQSDVWEIPKPTASPLHPAQEPLALLERAIVNSSRPGALILDPFAGSGSTLIACERTGRVAALIELDPIYCDVIIARWEAFTGHTARLVTGADAEPAEGGR